MGAEAWLIGTGVSDGATAPVRHRRLAWLYDPRRRVAELSGVVSVGPGAPVAVAGSVVPDVVPAVVIVASPALGLADVSWLLARVDTVAAVGTPGPVESGSDCDIADPWNWGDPRRTHRPCGEHVPAKGRTGSLLVDGGEGQGFLVVDGSVTFQDGAFYRGLVMASGRVELRGDSRLEGRVIAYGGVVVESRSVIVGSALAAEAALTGAREPLGRAMALHAASRLGPG